MTENVVAHPPAVTIYKGGFRTAALSVFAMTRNHSAQTPPQLFAALHREFSFTIDLAADESNALCARFYGPNEDSLLQDWSAERGFCNPPYGRLQRFFVEKAVIESQRGATIVMLLPVRTESILWQEQIFKHASEVRFLRGRLRFGGEDGSHGAPFGSAVVVFFPQ